MSKFSFWGGVLTLLACVLFPFPSVFASSAQHRSEQPSTQNVAQAGASVVRLLVSYVTATSTAHPPTEIQCTGLGVLVSSRTSGSGSDQNTWILTGGSLVNSKLARAADTMSCVNSSLPAKLASIKIFFSSAYNQQAPAISLDGAGLQKNIYCQNTNDCSKGLALFSFNDNLLLPYIDVARGIANPTAKTTPQGGIALSRDGSSAVAFPQAATFDAQHDPQYASAIIPGFLTPNQAPLNMSGLEMGTPLVDSSGDLVSMHLNGNASNVSSSAMATFLGTQHVQSPAPSNAVHDAWNKGIAAFYSKQYGIAHTAFQQVTRANPQFQGAATFAQIATTNATTQSATTTPLPANGVQLLQWKLPFWLISIAGLVALVLILMLATLIFGRPHKRSREFTSDYEAAKRESEREVERAREQEQPGHGVMADQPTFVPDMPALPLNMATTPLVMPNGSIVDQPTTEMPLNGQGPRDPDKTEPYAFDHVREKHAGLRVVTRTNPGIKRKYKPNEDNLFAGHFIRGGQEGSSYTSLLVVADGMGGHANGQDASRTAIQTIIEYILPRLAHEALSTDADYQQLLLDGVQSANRAVHQQNVDQRGDSGTTITSALVVDTTAYVANVGDSRTYLYREPEGLGKVTQDHSVVASLVAAGIIQPDDIYTHPKRNQIYRSLGERPAIEIDPFIVHLQPNDLLLLCSDGLWDMVRDPQIEHVLKSSTSLEQVGDGLIQAALDGGGEDNVSVIVAHMSEAAGVAGQNGFHLVYKPEMVNLPVL
ncbi:MAG TPA: protein phosphatase 2C domain-containing protein [Ktedonobacteraceae bacterium]|nr:protein phosphatase 2C domain-containing protein [Ktedonobacteraceae bacterium]